MRREQECNAYIPCGLLPPPIPASTNGPFDWDDPEASALLNPRRHSVAARCQLCGPFDEKPRLPTARPFEHIRAVAAW